MQSYIESEDSILDVRTIQIFKERLVLGTNIQMMQNTIWILVEPGGIEPPTPCLQSRCSPS